MIIPEGVDLKEMADAYMNSDELFIEISKMSREDMVYIGQIAFMMLCACIQARTVIDPAGWGWGYTVVDNLKGYVDDLMARLAEEPDLFQDPDRG